MIGPVLALLASASLAGQVSDDTTPQLDEDTVPIAADAAPEEDAERASVFPTPPPEAPEPATPAPETPAPETPAPETPVPAEPASVDDDVAASPPTSATPLVDDRDPEASSSVDEGAPGAGPGPEVLEASSSPRPWHDHPLILGTAGAGVGALLGGAVAGTAVLLITGINVVAGLVVSGAGMGLGALLGTALVLAIVELRRDDPSWLRAAFPPVVAGTVALLGGGLAAMVGAGAWGLSDGEYDRALAAGSAAGLFGVVTATLAAAATYATVGGVMLVTERPASSADPGLEDDADAANDVDEVESEVETEVDVEAEGEVDADVDGADADPDPVDPES